IENKSVSLPKKERLLSLAYSLDPENKENLYARFLTLASYNLDNAEKEFNQFANMKQANCFIGPSNLLESTRRTAKSVNKSLPNNSASKCSLLPSTTSNISASSTT